MITGFYAGILALLYIYLSFRVIMIRGAQKISLGHGGFEPLDIAIRVHGNFSEYVPMGLILLALLEMNGTTPWVLYTLGTLLVLGRVLHISAFYNPAHLSLPRRVAGMILTLSGLLISGLYLITEFIMASL